MILVVVLAMILHITCAEMVPFDLALNETTTTSAPNRTVEPIFKKVRLHGSSRILHKTMRMTQPHTDLQLPIEGSIKKFYKPKRDPVEGSLSVFPNHKQVNKVMLYQTGKDSSYYLVMTVPEGKQDKVFVVKIPQPKSPTNDKVIFDQPQNVNEEFWS